MQRVTTSDLEAACRRINRTVNGWDHARCYDAGNKPIARSYHLSGAYGGYALQRMSDEGTGVHDVLGGHLPKRELYDRMQAFLSGIEAVSDD